MFANGNPLLHDFLTNAVILVDTSPEYEKFLQFVARRITLKGWTEYRGGLDVNSK